MKRSANLKAKAFMKNRGTLGCVSREKTMRAIVLAGGLGMRLRPLTDDKPKALIPVNGKPISEYQVEWLLKDGRIDSVTFACGYKWERLK